MGEKILILSGRSLFTDGLISQLIKSNLLEYFDVINLCQEDPLPAVVKANPSVLVVDRNDPEFASKLMGRLYDALPSMKIIFLDPETPRIRVVHWSEQDVLKMSDLINEISSSGLPERKIGSSLENMIDSLSIKASLSG